MGEAMSLACERFGSQVSSGRMSLSKALLLCESLSGAGVRSASDSWVAPGKDAPICDVGVFMLEESQMTR